MATEVLYYVSSSQEQVATLAADRLLAGVESAVAARGVARLAISGGNTPRPVFELLADPAAAYLQNMPWSCVELYWVDERCVPPDHADSNYRMTREAMLDKVPLPAGQVFRMEGELNPEHAAGRYEGILRSQFGLDDEALPEFDAIWLGMGDDGHTASLFPHTAALHEQSRLVVANHVPQKDTWRLTLTRPVIAAAREVTFLIAGADKAAVLRQVLMGPYDPEQYPSQFITPTNGRLVLLLDKAAAASLPAPGPDGWGRLELER